jgi:hypothetical protein
MFVRAFVLIPLQRSPLDSILHITLGRAVALLWICIQTESEYNSTHSFCENWKTEKNRGSPTQKICNN